MVALVHKISHAGARPSEALTTNYRRTSRLAEQASAPSFSSEPSVRLPLKVYGVMALTTMLTFGTLTTGYQLLFSQQVFA